MILIDTARDLEKKDIYLPYNELWKKSKTYKKMDKKYQIILDKIFLEKHKDKSKGTILHHFYKLLYKYNKRNMVLYYRLFSKQNLMINNNMDYQLELEHVPTEFTTIFKDFFYGTFFNNVEIWETLINKQFSKRVFFKNFKYENRITACPYCDVDTTTLKANNNLDHFLPKSKYPFISMSALNLVPCCISCNSIEEGKAAKIQKIIASPFNEEIGSKLKFIVDYSSRSITIPDTKVIKYDNYIDLMNLKARYGDELVFEDLDRVVRGVLNTLSRIDKPTEIDVQDEINRNDRLTFAIKHVIVNDVYEEYREKVDTLLIRNALNK